MSDLVAWCLSVFGFTYIVIYSKIFKPFREFLKEKSQKLGELFQCPLCLGFWVGLLAHFMCGSPTHNLLFDGTLGAIASWIGTLLIAHRQHIFENLHTSRKSCRSCTDSQQPFAQ